MTTRFTDNLLNNIEGNDFIVRRHGPAVIQLFLIFAIAFVAIYCTAFIMNDLGNKTLFFFTLALTIGSLGWFTILFATRNRDLVLATEFQNAILASATQLGTRFCLITKNDGSIVYIDPAFQKLFPHFMHSDSHTISRLFYNADIPKELSQKIYAALENNQNIRLLLPFKDASDNPMPMMVTVDVLPRPKGYFLFRGRDFIENRSTSQAETAAKDQVSALLLAQALYALPEGVIVANHTGIVTYVNHALEEWLGYSAGEIVNGALGLQDLFCQYPGKAKGEMVAKNFDGEVSLQRKNRTLVNMQVRQALLSENGEILGISAIVSSPAILKKPVTISSEANAALQLSHFIASSPLAIARLNVNGTVLECNRSLRELVKFKVPDTAWLFLDIVSQEDRASVTALIEKICAGQNPDKKPLEITLNTDETITASLYLNRMESDASEIIAQLIDTTEQKNLEQRFAHSQKMQAVGQLAGGVAHDFNNLLTAMIGFCDLLLMRHPAGDQSFADIMQVKQNANRAANLVRQLLAFSRRQTLQPKMLDVTDVLAELSNLVRRLIGENIELKVIHGRDLGVVKADQGQLEQVFINLAVNARDAMQNGGRLTIQTSHIAISSKNSIGRDLVPPIEDEAIVDGDYVLVEVIDTGTGIARDLLQKIFEPFFSTKEVGSGTGLGLATVYGIIKQTGGYIYVSSKEGEGTKFSLFFKRYPAEEVKTVPEIEAVDRTASDDLTGKGTLLLVEDETPVRAFAARALRNKGYTVLEADCGEMAIEVMEAQGKEVDVIITDVIMPGINGPTMIEAIAPRFPRVKVVFISGYAEDVFVKSYGSEREFNFLAKPFTLKQLASKVKEVIQK